MTSSLANRQMQPERMDAPDLDRISHFRALDGLRRIHFWSGTARTYFRTLAHWAFSNGPLRVLDLACGGGDVIFALERMARRARVPLGFDGCDVSQTALERAGKEAAERSSVARFFKLNVLESPLPEDYDVILSSLFLHHLTEEQTVIVLRRIAKSCRVGLLLSDLERRSAGYWLAATIPRLLTRSPVVHEDSVKSVRAAYRMEELATLAGKSGLADFHLYRCWPCRMQLAWRRNDA